MPPRYKNWVVCLYLWPAASMTSGGARVVWSGVCRTIVSVFFSDTVFLHHRRTACPSPARQWRSFVTAELVSLSTDTSCAGCRRAERTLLEPQSRFGDKPVNFQVCNLSPKRDCGSIGFNVKSTHTPVACPSGATPCYWQARCDDLPGIIREYSCLYH